MVIFRPRRQIILYPEITKLNRFIAKYNCHCKLPNGALKHYGDLIRADFTINNTLFTVYLDDEYDDVSLNNSALLVLLALRSLEHIQDTTDYLQWCNQLFLDPDAPELLEYYKAATRFCEQLIILFDGGKIESFISDLDFELNAGAAQYLRKQSSE